MPIVKRSRSLARWTQPLRLLVLGFGVLVSFAAPLKAPPLAAAPEDGVPWDFVAEGKVVAIGDIHGDFDALAEVLTRQGLIDEAGSWIGGDTHVVLLGDINGKGDETRLCMDLIMRLEREAPGRWHAVRGNHEVNLILQDLRATSREERRGFRDADVIIDGQLKRRLRKTFGKAHARFLALMLSRGSRYAARLANGNVGVRIHVKQSGKTLAFVHGGLQSKTADIGLGALNATFRAVTAGLRGLSEADISPYLWIAQSDLSPVEDRRLANTVLNGDNGKKDRQQLDNVLTKLNANTLVIGHSPTGGKIAMSADERLIDVDVGLSKAVSDGDLRWVVFEDGKTVKQKTERVENHPLRQREVARRMRCAEAAWDFETGT